MQETLKPWYAVATPHEDIRERRLAEAVFAANVWAVVQGTAPEVYLDPEQCFRKTYLTTGLSTVMRRVAKALSRSSEAGDRIISLQTAFGGGKTHTLVALWHLAKPHPVGHQSHPLVWVVETRQKCKAILQRHRWNACSPDAPAGAPGGRVS